MSERDREQGRRGRGGERAAGGDLAEALRVMFGGGSYGGERDGALQTIGAPAFRALVAERLRALERDLAEVRARVNGLLFVVAGAVVTQVVLRVVG